MNSKKIGIKYSQYKSRAKFKNIEFKLTKKDFNFILQQDCFFCKTPKANGIDRYINKKGYYHGNVVPCCWTCNRAKSDLTIIEFEDYLQKFTGVDVSVERQKEKLKEEPNSLERANKLFTMFEAVRKGII